MMKISALSRQYYALLDGWFLVCSSNYLVFSNINQNGFSKFCKLKLNTEITPLPVPWVVFQAQHSGDQTKFCNFDCSIIHAEGFFLNSIRLKLLGLVAPSLCDSNGSWVVCAAKASAARHRPYNNTGNTLPQNSVTCWKL